MPTPDRGDLRLNNELDGLYENLLSGEKLEYIETVDGKDFMSLEEDPLVKGRGEPCLFH